MVLAAAAVLAAEMVEVLAALRLTVMVHTAAVLVLVVIEGLTLTVLLE
jgi:hypothetical protein